MVVLKRNPQGFESQHLLIDGGYYCALIIEPGTIFTILIQDTL